MERTVTVEAKAPKPEVDCERLISKAQDIVQQLETRVARLEKATDRLYPQPRGEQTDNPPGEEGWVGEMDRALNAIELLLANFGGELDRLNRFME